MFPEKPMEPLTHKEWKKDNRSKFCHICLKEFVFDPKVRDHCHYTESTETQLIEVAT